MTIETRESKRMSHPLEEVDPQIAEVIRNEVKRQATSIELIPSENFVSEAVLEAMGSVLTNKYAEGYPGKRYYGGCEFVDIAEQLAIDRAKQLFGADHANVQPHSGTQANVAVYMAALQFGDTVLGMNLAHGGHLTHGHPLNFSGKMYKFMAYGVRQDTELIDSMSRSPGAGAQAQDGSGWRERVFAHHRLRAYGQDRAIGGRAAVCGHGAHCRTDRGRRASQSRAPRGLCDHHDAQNVARAARRNDLCRERYAKEVDRNLFPGGQGGPLMHIIAAKAVCLKEAMEPEFRDYQKQIVANAKALAAGLAKRGFRIVSGGTDNHLFLLEIHSRGITGAVAQPAFDRAGIT